MKRKSIRDANIESVIEDNIPLTPKRRSEGTKLVYPFAVMQPGQSFAIDKEWFKSVADSATKYGRKHNKTFTTRMVDDKARCYRLK